MGVTSALVTPCLHQWMLQNQQQMSQILSLTLIKHGEPQRSRWRRAELHVWGPEAGETWERLTQRSVPPFFPLTRINSDAGYTCRPITVAVGELGAKWRCKAANLIHVSLRQPQVLGCSGWRRGERRALNLCCLHVWSYFPVAVMCPGWSPTSFSKSVCVKDKT